jgi:uncharacterized SAM-binding protein YcdF (DUF218 family)
MMENSNRRGNGHGRIFFSLVGCLTGLFLLFSALYLGLRAAGAYLIVADELVPVKAIVVLSGGTEPRMREALRLYEEGFGSIIILTETGGTLRDSEQLYSFDMRIQLMNNGVPSGNIVITEMQVSSTIDEARAVRETLTNQQFPSAIIVTDPYHTRRTRMVFREAFADSPIEIYIRPAGNSWYNSRTWFLNAQGWQFTTLEYIKLVGYQLGLNE